VVWRWRVPKSKTPITSLRRSNLIHNGQSHLNISPISSVSLQLTLLFKVICNTFITRTRDIIFLSLILCHWMVTNFLEYGLQIDQSTTHNVLFKFRVMIHYKFKHFIVMQGMLSKCATSLSNLSQDITKLKISKILVWSSTYFHGPKQLEICSNQVKAV
jgi:hypothetical protein